jgi:hypothetical protein
MSFSIKEFLITLFWNCSKKKRELNKKIILNNYFSPIIVSRYMIRFFQLFQLLWGLSSGMEQAMWSEIRLQGKYGKKAFRENTSLFNGVTRVIPHRFDRFFRDQLRNILNILQGIVDDIRSHFPIFKIFSDDWHRNTRVQIFLFFFIPPDRFYN